MSAAICIIGAGAAGITLACELDGTDLAVTLLEAAGIGWGGGVSQDPYQGSAVAPHPNPANFRRRAFGGSTTIWGGRCVPFDPIDFERRDYVPNSGWPISYQEVARHYPKAMAYCDAGAFEFTVGTALANPRPILPGLEGDADIDGDMIERYSLPTDFGTRYRDRLARSTNIRVVTHAQVLRLEKEPGGDRIAAALFRTPSGRTGRVEARAFVLALGGIETTRLLLVSDGAGNGLGNRSDCLGRYYACHVENVIGVLRPRRGGVVFHFEKTRDGVYGRRKLHIRAAAQRREGLRNIAFRLHYPDVSDPRHRSPVLSAVYLAKRTLIPEYRRILQHGAADAVPGAALRHFTNVALGLPALAGFGVHYLGRRLLARRKLPYVLVANPDGSYPIEFNSEQTPSPASRITLNGDRDAYGVPRVHVDWRFNEDDIDSIARAYRLLRDRLSRIGTAVVEFDDATLRERIARSQPVGGHHLGTTRMAGSPATGVVDKDCAVFGLPNLYLASASVFPTSSHANPTLTIVALAIRLAQHLVARFGARHGGPYG